MFQQRQGRPPRGAELPALESPSLGGSSQSALCSHSGPGRRTWRKSSRAPTSGTSSSLCIFPPQMLPGKVQGLSAWPGRMHLGVCTQHFAALGTGNHSLTSCCGLITVTHRSDICPQPGASAPARSHARSGKAGPGGKVGGPVRCPQARRPPYLRPPGRGRDQAGPGRG